MVVWGRFIRFPQACIHAFSTLLLQRAKWRCQCEPALGGKQPSHCPNSSGKAQAACGLQQGGGRQHRVQP